jgi:hypothetical protein
MIVFEGVEGLEGVMNIYLIGMSQRGWPYIQHGGGFQPWVWAMNIINMACHCETGLPQYLDTVKLVYSEIYLQCRLMSEMSSIFF